MEEIKAIIYIPTNNAMQSGMIKNKKWVLKYLSPTKSKFTEPLMGWTGSNDNSHQIIMKFDTKEKAEEYAKQKNLTYEIIESNQRKFKPKSYSDNFIHRIL